jgi:hypothetical protein
MTDVKQWIVIGTSMIIEDEPDAEAAINRAQDMSGWNWEAIPAVDLNPLVHYANVLEAAQEAQDAALGDSNDTEIELLRDALEMALSALHLELPEPRDPDDEDA